ncbi:MAG: EAL domain-containing protein [Gammaproteobacteria bacterium]|nr:EAL domain-containing protein [Gammaproteobacteria bacterium]
MTEVSRKYAIGIRGKLIALFVVIKVVPLVLLAYFAWQQSEGLARTLQNHFDIFEQIAYGALEETAEQASSDSVNALEDRARNEVERMTTDTAQALASFLYARDDDVLLASRIGKSKSDFSSFITARNSRLLKELSWHYSEPKAQWVPSMPPLKQQFVESSLPDNSKRFHYRPPEIITKTIAPLYLEMTFVSLQGMELIKVTTSDLLTNKLLDISLRNNTYIKAETYFRELQKLSPGEVYVSDVIGGYVPTHFIGAYTQAKAKKNGIPFAPEQSAYAGKENPVGKKFQGIIRWATPVVEDGVIIGYITLALNHDHILNFTNGVMPTDQRYTSYPDPSEGNYAFIWDHKGRNIAHPRHYFIYGYNRQNGKLQVPWLEQDAYNHWMASGLEFEKYAKTAEHYKDQRLSRKPAQELGKTGLRGLDCRFLNFAPQCKGWFDITEHGGSGSFVIFWSGLWRLVTAAPIPYYTGQYGNSKRGFGVVTVGTNIDDFSSPAIATKERIDQLYETYNDAMVHEADMGTHSITDNLQQTADILVISTLIMIIIVVLIAVWVASYFSHRITQMVSGIGRFRRGNHSFRFQQPKKDEISELADAFDTMADDIDENVARLKLEIRQRRNSEVRLLELTQSLEYRVIERTKDLSQEIVTREQAEKQIRFLAENDDLTKLFNRRGFNQKMDKAFLGKESFALLLLDMDKLKAVNDYLGHNIGDKVLVYIANLLKKTVRTGDAVARIGGDEFAMIINGVADVSEISPIVDRVLETLSMPSNIEGQLIHVGASIGISFKTTATITPEQLYVQADVALYKAKSLGGQRYICYDKKLEEVESQFHDIAQELRSAMVNNEFCVYFQPQINTATHKVHGVESLLRWNHPTKGMLLPGDFMYIAEELGMVRELDYWMLKEVCRKVSGWIKDDLSFGRVAINVGVSDLLMPNYVSDFSAVLESWSIAPSLFEIELLENTSVDDVNTFLDTLNQLHKLGVSFALDDFGTGFSSMQRMVELPIEAIKIDKYFISRIGDPGIEAIIKAMITMANSQSITIVAEGVEELQQQDFLQAHGCHIMQGFLHQRPIDDYQFHNYLSSR